MTVIGYTCIYSMIIRSTKRTVASMERISLTRLTVTF